MAFSGNPPSGRGRVIPRLACEIFADRVVAARAAEAGGFIEVHTARTLPAGAVVPSLTTPNLVDAAGVVRALRDALAAVGGRSRDVIAVIPDSAVRVVLLDFDSLPQDAQQAAGVVRFRLRKSLPFDVDKAVISYHASRAAQVVKVIAVVALASVIGEYEAALQEAGYAPGIILPSTLAALGIVDGAGPTLIIKSSDSMTTVAIVDQQQLRLFRTLEHAGARAPEMHWLADAVYPSLVFYQDHFNSSIERVLVGGEVSAADLAPALQQQTAARIADMLGESYVSGGLTGNVSTPLAGVAGALLA